MKSMLSAALVAASLGGVAQAETFTFSNATSGFVSVTVPGPNNTTRIAGVSDFKGTTTMSGKSVATSGKCAVWPSLPADIFQSHGQCTLTDGNGAGYIRFGCNPGKTAMDDDCVSGIWGTGGAYAGRHGTLAWHNKVAADGKSSSAEGAGQWGD
jgi:hypothetical protein